MTDSKPQKAALFLNGLSYSRDESWADYGVRVAADGACSYLNSLDMELDYVVGDLDSWDSRYYISRLKSRPLIVHIADQNTTDMEKALSFIYHLGYRQVHIYGASGLAQDHFLGNLHVGHKFLYLFSELLFFDEYYRYFFLPLQMEIVGVKNCLISLVPFPAAYGIHTHGLQYALEGEDLVMGTRIGIRNRALSNRITINFRQGTLLIFIERRYKYRDA